jgi:DNA invertase Pin-like site-specific DNA recombinase
MTRVALYARVSSKAQAEEDKVSISEQFAEMESHYERHGYQVVRRYQEVQK